MTGSDGEATWRFASRMAMMLFALSVGLWVAAETVGFYPTLNHCPDVEGLVCPSSNPRNMLPALVGSVVALFVMVPMTYALNCAVDGEERCLQ